MAQAVIWWGEMAQAVIWWGEMAQAVIWWVVLVILVSSPVQSFEIWSSTGLSLDNFIRQNMNLTLSLDYRRVGEKKH